MMTTVMRLVVACVTAHSRLRRHLSMAGAPSFEGKRLTGDGRQRQPNKRRAVACERLFAVIVMFLTQGPYSWKSTLTWNCNRFPCLAAYEAVSGI